VFARVAGRIARTTAIFTTIITTVIPKLIYGARAGDPNISFNVSIILSVTFSKNDIYRSDICYNVSNKMPLA